MEIMKKKMLNIRKPKMNDKLIKITIFICFILLYIHSEQMEFIIYNVCREL